MLSVDGATDADRELRTVSKFIRLHGSKSSSHSISLAALPLDIVLVVSGCDLESDPGAGSNSPDGIPEPNGELVADPQAEEPNAPGN